MTENNYPPGCTQTDHDEAHKDDAPSCPECGSAPCSCGCIACGDDAPTSDDGYCIACAPPHAPDCRCEDCHRGPDRLVDENGAEL